MRKIHATPQCTCITTIILCSTNTSLCLGEVYLLWYIGICDRGAYIYNGLIPIRCMDEHATPFLQINCTLYMLQNREKHVGMKETALLQLCAFMCVCTCVCLCACMCVCLCMCLCVCMCVCVCGGFSVGVGVRVYGWVCVQEICVEEENMKIWEAFVSACVFDNPAPSCLKL